MQAQGMQWRATWALHTRSSCKGHNNKDDVFLITGGKSVMNIAILLIALVSSEKVYFILTTKKSFGAKRHTVKVILVFKWAEL